MREVELSAGTIEYEDTGGEGPVLVLLHGLAQNGSVGATWSQSFARNTAASFPPCLWAGTATR
jgi:pimeloyl-ACP methyl ester carboxylesterase